MHSPVAWQRVNKVVSASEDMVPNSAVSTLKIENKQVYFGLSAHTILFGVVGTHEITWSIVSSLAFRVTKGLVTDTAETKANLL